MAEELREVFQEIDRNHGQVEDWRETGEHI